MAIYSTFLQRAIDQVIHDVALQNLPVVFAIDRGGLVGADGATHHGFFDISLLRTIPNMTVMTPSDVKVEKPAPQSGPAARKPSAEEANPLLPSKADMEKAREERAHGHLPPKFDRQTKIEEVRDENNRVTEYVVTPGTTQIPYRIENRAERPIDSSPAGNSKSTLGTTKFIELGW